MRNPAGRRGPRAREHRPRPRGCAGARNERGGVQWIWARFAAGNLIDLGVRGRGHLFLVAAFILLLVTGIVYITARRPGIAAVAGGLAITNPVRGHRIGWGAVTGRPLIEQLAFRTNESVTLAVAKRFNVVYVDQVDPPELIMPEWRGRSLPLHASSGGKVFLAWLRPEERGSDLARGATALHRPDDHRSRRT